MLSIFGVRMVKNIAFCIIYGFSRLDFTTRSIYGGAPRFPRASDIFRGLSRKMSMRQLGKSPP